MQSINEVHNGTADFDTGAVTWRMGQNIRAVFDFGLFPALYDNVT